MRVAGIRKYTSSDPSSRPRTTAEIRAQYGRGGGGGGYGDGASTSDRARAANRRYALILCIADCNAAC
jgi:hypothetical protein